MKGPSWSDVGLIAGVPAVLAVVPGGLALVNDAERVAAGFGACALASVVVALLLRCCPKATERSTGSLLATMAVAWLVVPLIGALPFAVAWSGDGWSVRVWVDACFESMSGFTSCGLTIVASPSELPESLQLWRSLTQWVGGIGVAAVMLAALNPAVDAGKLIRAEVGHVLQGGPKKAARWMWSIYSAATGLAIVVFWALGMPLWEALNHGLTATSTGGFTVTDDSLASYTPAIQLSATLFMLFGAISFGYYYRVLADRRVRALRSPVVALLLIGSALAALALIGVGQLGDDPVAPDAVVAWFEVASAVATGGFGIADLSTWSPALLALLGLCMFVGGASGSTAGGVKLDRVVLIARGVWWRLRRDLTLAEPERVVVVDRERLLEGEARLRVEAAATLVAVWVATLGIATFVLWTFTSDQATLSHVAFEAVSALSSVGLSAGVTAPDLHAGGKLTLAALMWLGRLEVFAGLFLVMHTIRWPLGRIVRVTPFLARDED